MDKKKNGHDTDKIVSFPNAEQRDAQRKAEEIRLRENYKARQKAEKKRDHQPFFNAGNIPPFTKIFITAIILCHIVLSLLLSSGTRLYVIYTFGFMPAAFTGNFEFNPLSLLSPLTHIFIHGGWLHLMINAAMGLALSMFFERLYGTRTTLIFSILCALGGAALYMLLNPFTTTPVIGASGIISGFFGAMLLLTLQQIRQQDRIYSSRSIISGQHALKQKVSKLMKDRGPWPILIFWGFLMTFFGLLMGGNVSWSAHLGGYATGIALLTLMQKGKIRL